MNINRHSLRTSYFVLLTSLTLLIEGSANADPSISNVSARQRWPWNSLVDIDFTIGGASEGEAFFIDVTASAENGARTLYAKSFTSEPIAKAGANRIVWDFGVDYPDYRADDVRVTVTATPISDSTPVYMVVDLSGGASATSYPVHYTTNAPTMTVGQEDPCKTTELWLRRVKAKNIVRGYGSTWTQKTTNYDPHYAMLTNDFYIGIFPLTQAQAYNIKGAYYSYFTNETCRATRPMDAVNIATVRGSYGFPPRSVAKTSGSILRNLEDRTGLPFDLPTEWQWEFALRAGTTENYYPGAKTQNKRDWSTLEEPRNATEDYGTLYVDHGNPNSWGLYCIFGNVWEWCLNQPGWFEGIGANKATAYINTQDNPKIDPCASASYSPNYKFMVRGVACTFGTLNNNGRLCSFSQVDARNVNNYTSLGYGARVCLTIP